MAAPPPTATPIRFLPIKQPVFLLGKPCQQWSLAKRHGGGIWGPGLPTNMAHKVNETCARQRPAAAGQRLGRAGHTLERGSQTQESKVAM